MSVPTRMAHRDRARRCRSAVALGGVLASALLFSAGVGMAAGLPGGPAVGAIAARGDHIAATAPAAVAAATPATPTLAATPAPSPASGTGAATPTFAPRPPTKDGPVPTGLRPTIAAASTDYPAPYLDGCHVPLDGDRPSWSCAYGRTNAKTTVVLFGDSHALSWFPAVLRLANDRGWRLLSLTMSACSPADIPQWIAADRSVSTACGSWRQWALRRIEKEKPAVVLVAGTRGFATVDAAGHVASGSARTAIWERGIDRTLARLVRAAGRVIYLSDTPASAVDPPACLARNPKSTLACATPLARAVNIPWFSEEARVAVAEGVGFIDTTGWICPTAPCPVTVGRLLVYRDGGHMTATFAASRGPQLEAAVLADLRQHRPRGATP